MQADDKRLHAKLLDNAAILAACLEGRARKMRQPLQLPPPLTTSALKETLEQLGKAFVREGTRPSSVAVFRLAIAEPDPEIAAVLDAAVREANRAAVADFLADAQKRGLLRPGDAHLMAGQYLALLWGDLFMRLLLRVSPAPNEGELERRAGEASRIILLAYGTR